MPSFPGRSFFFALPLVLCCAAAASVKTYPGPADSLRSKKYRVRVIQSGKSRNSFVYANIVPVPARGQMG